ncbi:DNA-directed RNA polymerase subunit sigma [Tenacibaculum holothuriorum]|uniref:DNA-directed RNA polymerase subunit sigma n=1 Tax=Tenacibaculum holothuriorum TaxID=1635173 RepID=A0A1Y2PGJ0_9FLAO|nr:RNA polymerase sigma factor [Tenacibaculum holothuriorum]OSY89121.1 DNA-directed RNA polymerase subunit sigma [Tenacibaculum holothuriorum]
MISLESQKTHINQLIKRCKSNDSNAQMQVYKSYYKAMYNSAFRILKDEFEAEDLMQEAFLTAFTKLHTFKGEVTFGAWLKRIVINKSLTQLKKNNRYDEVKMEVIPNYETEEITNIDYSSLEAKKVLSTINNLKDNYRIVLTLNLIEGYDYEEIAQILNYSNENVRTTISRAKKKLKQVLLVNTNKTQVYGR